MMERLRRREVFGAWLPLGLVLALVAGLAYALWPRSAPSPVPISPAVVILPASPSPAPTPTPTPAPQPVATNSVRRPPRPSPPPGGTVVALTPAPEAVGWTSDLDGRAHFGVPNIHAGSLNVAAYQGALQFYLGTLPLGATITAASLELTGLSAEQLTADGVWRLQLLAPAIDAAWPALSYEMLHRAASEATLPLALTRAELVAGQVNVFSFDPAALAVLQARRLVGLISLRLDGPAGDGNNLFTWDTGYRLNRELDTQPALVVVLAATPASQYVIVTSTPTPENVLTVAAMASRATAVARTTGTYTPLPGHWVTPVVITSTPTPATAATAAFQAAVATAESLLYGTPTPLPPNIWTATPAPTQSMTTPAAPRSTDAPSATPTSTPTPVFVLLEGQLPLLLSTRAPTPSPRPMPAPLIGKIAFLSDRASLAYDPSAPPLANPLVYVVNPDGTGLALLTDRWPYNQAIRRDRLSADQRYRAFVRDVSLASGQQPAVFYYDDFYRGEGQVTKFGAGIAYDPAWSPTAERIALVSNDSGNDEIWVINRDGSQARQLTRDTFGWWDKHPSWSPDGRQIVFWSNRAGRRQILMMDADGRNLRTLSMTGFNDWDPVWIKYADPPGDNSGD